MEGAAESAGPAHAQLFDLFGLGDRLWDDAQRSCLIHRLMRSVTVVVLLELPERSEKVALVPGQCPVEQRTV